jgi:hypothetical protein
MAKDPKTFVKLSSITGKEQEQITICKNWIQSLLVPVDDLRAAF